MKFSHHRYQPSLCIRWMVGVIAFGWIGTIVVASAGDRVRPNILLVISDDQSFPHTSISGCKAVRTPAFDRVAREGVLFRNGFAASPGCSPSRASLLTGRHIWQIEQAGTHLSSFPTRYACYPDLLEAQGYAVGYTGKGWGPGDFAASGRTRNPAGPQFNQLRLTPPTRGISPVDYAANFKRFLNQRKKDQPFCFWYGAAEPHLDYEDGSGIKAGKDPRDVSVPDFLPDSPVTRRELLDYALEIEWFDSHLAKMLDALAAEGELDNTLVIVTSDNGMPFPRSKATCYEYGVHVPLAVRWGSKVPGGRVVDDLVGFVDLTATILEAASVTPPKEDPPSGRSLLGILESKQQGVVDASRDAVWAGRERHSSSRYANLGYPQRAMRTSQFLYIRNFTPERWPMGDPRVLLADGGLGPMNGAYYDIDTSNTRELLLHGADDSYLNGFLQLAVAKRPAEELFDVIHDPGCLRNLAEDPAHLEIKARLASRMDAYLKATGDTRVLGNGEIWETYKRYSNIRKFPPP